MMPKPIQKLQIFLASPGDVPSERKYVAEVVEEVNRTIASPKGLVLEVVRWETHTFPGYGSDPQALVNPQIAKMGEYDLFVGIMWNRLGTPTPRAASGTVEEFNRAVAAKKRKGQPAIWFYFRKMELKTPSDEQLEQQKKVNAFKRRVRPNALAFEYPRPQDFRELFRPQLTMWLNSFDQKAVRPPPTAQVKPAAKPIIKPLRAAVNAPLSSNLRASGKAVETPVAVVSSRTKKAVSVPPKTPSTISRAITSSGAWVLLDGNFVLAKSVSHPAGENITLNIPVSDASEEAMLRGLSPDRYSRKKRIAYAYQNHAAFVDVEGVNVESSDGKTSFVISLKPNERSDSGMGFSTFNGISENEIATMQARLLLLNEKPREQRANDRFSMQYLLNAGNAEVKFTKGIFADLWARLQEDPKTFLPKAWLFANYALRVNDTIDDVLELKIGPVKNGTMPVHFRGQKRRGYGSEAPIIIEVTGDCRLTE